MSQFPHCTLGIKDKFNGICKLVNGNTAISLVPYSSKKGRIG